VTINGSIGSLTVGDPTYKKASRYYKSMRKGNRSKSQMVQPDRVLMQEQEKSEERKHDSCGPGCRFFLATSDIITRVVKIENE
jgi:hypothetical protein